MEIVRKEDDKMPKYEALVCLNGGTLPGEDFFRRFLHLPIYAVDGAVGRLLQMRIQPTAVLGDGDSLAALGLADLLLELCIPFIPLPDQNATDFDKTLHYLFDQQMRCILVTGLGGGELDHTFYNLSLMVKWSAKMQLIGLHTEEKKQQWVYVVQDSCELITKPEEIISIIPFPQATLSSTGLRWELNSTSFALPYNSSLRNQALGSQVKIVVHEGTAVVIVSFCHTMLQWPLILKELH